MHDRIAREYPHSSTGQASEQPMSVQGCRCMGLRRATGAAMWTKCVAVGPLAGAPGIEPGNGGIKIRCLTAWLRPNRDCLLRVTPWGFKARKPEPDRRTRSERLHKQQPYPPPLWA